MPIDRYTNLIAATLRVALRERKHPSDSMSAALGFVDLVANGAASASVDRTDQEAEVERRYVDGAGHSRPLYRGLSIYARGRTGELPIGTSERLHESCAGRFSAFLSNDAPPRASEGSQVVQLAFDAMALACAGWRSESAAVAGEVLTQIAARQRPDGPFLLRTASDNPEPTWYHELALLHAVSTFACRCRNDVAAQAMRRAAQYQAEQIQPDHASSHPFALHAFLRFDAGIYLADMMLHAAGVQEPATMDAVSLLLLADALDCIRNANEED